MNTVDKKEEEFAHIVLRESGENVLIFNTGDVLDMMDEFIGGYDAIIRPHDLS